MRYLLTTVLALALMLPAFSQADTSYVYYNIDWAQCHKDSATYLAKIYQQNNVWVRNDSWIKTGQLQMHGTYLDQACTKRDGKFSYYRENGTLKNTSVYEDGKPVTAEYFYESGKKKGNIVYTAAGGTQQGWDEDGNEIPGYVVEKEAMFPGGPNGWKEYLERHLNIEGALKGTKKAGMYTVKVQFIVDKKGIVSNVQAIETPALCERCAKEAVRVIRTGPRWEPAMQDNLPVIYQAIQYITFQVLEDR
jgi:hypothetical protein